MVTLSWGGSKCHVITWCDLRKVLLSICNTRYCFHIRKNLFLSKKKKKSRSGHCMFWTGTPHRGNDYQAIIKILWWNNQTCLIPSEHLTKPLGGKKIQNDFDTAYVIILILVLPLTPMLVLFVTAVKCKKGKKKVLKVLKLELNVYVLIIFVVSCLHFI